MKILLVSRFLPYVGGRETVVLSLAEELSKIHEVAVLTPDIGRASKNYSILGYDKKNIRRAIERFSPDIVNSHTFYLTEDLLRFCGDTPVCLTVHGDILNFGSEDDRALLLHLANKVHRLITVCEHGREELLKRGVPNSKVLTIHNGVDTAVFSERRLNRSQLRTSLRLPTDRRIFLTPARAVPHKGLEFLIQAAAEFKSERDLLFLVSVPATRFRREEVNYMEGLMELTHKLGVKDLLKFDFFDFSTMPLLYNACDGFVLPSKTEEFPVSILEALSSGLPVVATDVGGVGEVLNGQNGFLIDYGDIRGLAGVIERILRGDGVRGNVRRSRETVVKYFDKQRMVKKYTDMYLSLLNR